MCRPMPALTVRFTTDGPGSHEEARMLRCAQKHPDDLRCISWTAS